MKKHEIKYKKTVDLIPYARNARTHSQEQVAQIAASIKEFGFTNPVLIDSENGIIAGHGRVLAAQKLKLTEVPTIELGYLTETQKKAYIIADNKLALNAGWNDELLRLEFEDLLNEDFDIQFTGFSKEEAEDLLKKCEPDSETKEDDFDADKAVAQIKEPVTKPGDLWQLGRHRLLCGDSTAVTDVEKLMAGVKADLFLTDPPYNVDYEGGTKNKLKIQNDKKSDQDFRQFLLDAFSAADHVMKAGAVFYIWHAIMESPNFMGACQESIGKVRQILVWKKNSLVIGRQDYQWQHEPCLYGWKDGASHLWCSDRKQTTILEFDRPSKNKEHPTMKPVKLFDYQIQNNTKGEDVVLDLFGGSGTTMIACEQNGRNSYLMELDPVYCDVIIQRWEALTGEKAKLITS